MESKTNRRPKRFKIEDLLVIAFGKDKIIFKDATQDRHKTMKFTRARACS